MEEEAGALNEGGRLWEKGAVVGEERRRAEEQKEVAEEVASLRWLKGPGEGEGEAAEV